MQCPGWCWDGGDGRTRPMAKEVTSPAGLTSRRSPVRAGSSRSSSLRGLRRPLSREHRVGRTGVGGIVPRDRRRPCRTTSHSGGDGLTGGVGGTVPGHDSQACRGVDSSLTCAPANVSALNPLSGEQVGRRRARECVQLLIEMGPRSRGRAAPERGGIPLEGAPSPRARRNLTRGGDRPSSKAKFY
jgi:hypothetical protein